MKKMMVGFITGFWVIGMVGFANASTIISQVGTPAVTGSDGSGTLTNGWISIDLNWTHSYASITENIISATLTIDIIDADGGYLGLYTDSGSLIGKAYGNDNGHPGSWQGIGDNTIETTFFLQSNLFSDLADGTFHIYGDNVGMTWWGSNRSVLSIETVPIPGAIWLLGCSCAGLLALKERKRS